MEDSEPNYNNARIAKSCTRAKPVSVERTESGMWVVISGGGIHMTTHASVNRYAPYVTIDAFVNKADAPLWFSELH